MNWRADAFSIKAKGAFGELPSLLQDMASFMLTRGCTDRFLIKDCSRWAALSHPARCVAGTTRGCEPEAADGSV